MKSVEDINASGMILTDNFDFYSCKDSNGKHLPIIAMCNVKGIREFDKTILKQFITEKNLNDTVFVMGDNTFNDMRHVIERILREYPQEYIEKTAIRVLISSENEIQRGFLKKNSDDDNFSLSINNSFPRETDNKDDYRNQLLRECLKYCMETNISNIKVLGGKSVYEAFYYVYNEFYWCKVDNSVISDKKYQQGRMANNLPYTKYSSYKTIYSDGQYKILKYNK